MKIERGMKVKWTIESINVDEKERMKNGVRGTDGRE